MVVIINPIVELVYGKLRDSDDHGADLIAYSEHIPLAEAKQQYLPIARNAAGLLTPERHGLPSVRVALWSKDRAYALAAFHVPAKRLDRTGIETRYLIIPADVIERHLGGSLAWLLIDNHLRFLSEHFTEVTLLPQYTITINDPLARAVEAVQKVLSVLTPVLFCDILAGIRQRGNKSIAIANIEPMIYTELALALAMLTPVEQRTTLTFAIPSFSDLQLASTLSIAIHLSSSADVSSENLKFRFDCARHQTPLFSQNDPNIEHLRDLLTHSANNAALIRKALRYTARDMFSQAEVVLPAPRKPFAINPDPEPWISPPEPYPKAIAIEKLMLLDRKQDAKNEPEIETHLNQTWQLLTDTTYEENLTEHLLGLLHELGEDFVPFVHVLQLLDNHKRGCRRPFTPDQGYITILRHLDLDEHTIATVHAVYQKNTDHSTKEKKAYELWGKSIRSK